mmetsp:Transcript_9586/g.35137  ORF Transcript_9586/g.35137 Transcript_9586/m.35137 type:complete len:127 (+) Transcript_9586:1324-1704(+)|eukprot:scaffold3852_cov402-Prasinococcus_capsulatus_cf.AAC.6
MPLLRINLLVVAKGLLLPPASLLCCMLVVTTESGCASVPTAADTLASSAANLGRFSRSKPIQASGTSALRGSTSMWASVTAPVRSTVGHDATYSSALILDLQDNRVTFVRQPAKWARGVGPMIQRL